MAIPIILLLILGLVEFGRFIATTSTVTNASREAARYATTTGIGDNGVERYADCRGMRDAGNELGVIGTPDTISLNFDHGPGTTVFATCDGVDSIDPSSIVAGDRVISTARAQFDSIIPLIGNFIGSTIIEETTIRSINKGS